MNDTELLQGSPVQQSLGYQEEAMELFPTRFLRRRFSGVEGVNAKLRAAILERESASAGVTRSNVGRWHSESDFFSWAGPGGVVLKELLQDTVRAYVEQDLASVGRKSPPFEVAFEAWANVSRSGGYASPHVHPGAHLAMVYYVDAGEPPRGDSLSGVLELTDPRNRAHMAGGPFAEENDAFRVRPSTGTLLVFPAWVYHFAHPYLGERPRICVAANAMLRPERGSKQ